MYHPSVGIVHVACGLLATVTQFLHQPEERLMGLSEVGHLRRPVVHLGIDVEGILAVPCGVGAIVPDTLQVSRLSPRLRRGDQQVTAELSEQRHQGRILCFFERGDSLCGGQPLDIDLLSQVKGEAVKLAAVDLGMPFERFVVSLCECCVQQVSGHCCRIPVQGLIIPEAGTY